MSNTYLVIIHSKLFSINRLVEAATPAEAAAQVDQTGARTVWVELAAFEE